MGHGIARGGRKFLAAEIRYLRVFVSSIAAKTIRRSAYGKTIGVSMLLSLNLLSGCRPQINPLPSEEVLRRAAFASQKLDSSTFILDARFHFPLPAGPAGISSGHLLFEGVMQRGGDILSAHVGGEIDTATATQTRVNVQTDVSMVGEQELYVHIRELSLTPDDPAHFLHALDPLMGRWWRLPLSEGSSSQPRVTPDRRFFEAQSKVVKIDEDLGVETDLRRPAYHYRVTIDEAKLNDFLRLSSPTSKRIRLRATGELWIDAESFYLVRAHWNIDELQTSWGHMDASIDLTLSDHDRGHPVSLPEGAKTLRLSPLGSFDTFSEGSLLPPPPEEVDTDDR